MHENSQSPGRETDVGFAGSLAPVYPIAAQAVAPERAPEEELGLGVTAFIAAHIPAYFFLSGERSRLRFVFPDFLSSCQINGRDIIGLNKPLFMKVPVNGGIQFRELNKGASKILFGSLEKAPCTIQHYI